MPSSNWLLLRQISTKTYRTLEFISLFKMKKEEKFCIFCLSIFDLDLQIIGFFVIYYISISTWSRDTTVHFQIYFLYFKIDSPFDWNLIGVPPHHVGHRSFASNKLPGSAFLFPFGSNETCVRFTSYYTCAELRSITLLGHCSWVNFLSMVGWIHYLFPNSRSMLQISSAAGKCFIKIG